MKVIQHNPAKKGGKFVTLVTCLLNYIESLLQQFKVEHYIFAEGELGFLAFIRKAKKINIQKILLILSNKK
jgi:hypothetical protein